MIVHVRQVGMKLKKEKNDVTWHVQVWQVDMKANTPSPKTQT